MPARRFATITAAIALASASSAHAVNYVWDGGHPASSNWNALQNFGGTLRYSNWDVGGMNPLLPPIFQDVVRFGDEFTNGGFPQNPAPGIPILNLNATVNKLEIGHSSTQTIIAGGSNALTLFTGDLTRSSTSEGIQTIASPIVLGNTAQWDIAGDATNGTTRLDIAAAISGNFFLQKTGNAVLRFEGSNANTYLGATIVSEGRLTVAKPSGVASIPNNLNIDETGEVLYPANVSEQIVDTATVTVDAGTFDLNNAANTETVTTFNANGGATRLGGGTLNTTTFNANGGTISLESGALVTTTLNGDTNINMGNGASVTVDNDGSYSGTFGGIQGVTNLTKNGAGTFTLTGSSTLSIIDINSGTISVESGGSLTADDGGIVINGGTLMRDAASTIGIPSGQILDTTGGGSLDYTGATTLGSGVTYDLGGTFRHEGTLTIGGATVAHAGFLDGTGEDGTGNDGSDLIINSGSYFNNSSISLTGGDGGSAAGLIDGGNSGSITVNGGTLTTSSSFVMRGGGPAAFGGVGGKGGDGGSITVNGGNATIGSDVFIELRGLDGANSGGLNQDGGAGGDSGTILVTGGTLTINAGDYIDMRGGLGGDATNGGTNGANGQDGSVSVTGGTLVLNEGVFTSRNSPGTFFEPVAFENIPLTISGTGKVRVNADIIFARSSTIVTIDGGTLDASGTSNALTPTNGHTIRLGNGQDPEVIALSDAVIDLSGGDLNNSLLGGTGKKGGTLDIDRGSFDLGPMAFLDLRGGTGNAPGFNGGNGGTIVVESDVALAGTTDLSGRDGNGADFMDIASGGDGGNAGTVNAAHATLTLSGSLIMRGGDGGNDGNGVSGGNGGNGGAINVGSNGGNLVLNTGAFIDLTPGIGGGPGGVDGNPGSIKLLNHPGAKLTINAGTITANNTGGGSLVASAVDPILIEAATINVSFGILELKDDATLDNATIKRGSDAIVDLAIDKTLTAQNSSTLTYTGETTIPATRTYSLTSSSVFNHSGDLNLTDGQLQLDNATLNASGRSGSAAFATTGHTVTLSNFEAVLNAQSGAQILINGGDVISGADTGKDGGALIVNDGSLSLDSSSTIQGHGGAGPADSGNGGNGGTLTIAGGTNSLGGVVDLSGQDGHDRTGGFELFVAGHGGNAGSLNITGGATTLSNTLDLTGGEGGDDSDDVPSGGNGGNGGLVDISGGTLTLNTGTLINLSAGPGGTGIGGSDGADGTPGSVEISGTGQLVINAGTIEGNNTIGVNLVAEQLPGDPIHINNTTIDLDHADAMVLNDNTTLDVTTLNINANGGLELAAGTILNAINGSALNYDVSDTIQNWTFNILSGSSLAMNPSDAILDINGGATLLVDGAGSSLTTTLDETNNSNWGTGSGTNNITISNNATADVGGLALTHVGTGTTTLTVQSGADMTSGTLTIGTSTDGGDGILTVTGPGSTFTQNGASTLTVGLNICDTTAFLTVADSAVFTTGTGAILFEDSADVDILSGATFRALANITTDTGSVTVDNATLDASGVSGDAASATAGKTITLDVVANLDAQSGAQILIDGGDVTSGANSGNNAGALIVDDASFSLDSSSMLQGRGGAGPADGGSGGNGGTITVTAGTATLAGTTNLSGADGNERTSGTGNGGNGGNAGTLNVSGGGVTLSGPLNMTGGNGGEDTGAAPFNGGTGGNGGVINVTGGSLTLDPGTSIDLSFGVGAAGTGGIGDLGQLNIDGGDLILNGGVVTGSNTLTPSGDTTEFLGPVLVNLVSGSIDASATSTTFSQSVAYIQDGGTATFDTLTIDNPGAFVIDEANATFTVNTAINFIRGRLDGPVSGTATLTKTGPNTAELLGDTPNTFTGLTTVNEGTLVLSKGFANNLVAGNSQAAPPGVNAIGGNLTVNGGRAVLLNNNQIPDTATVTIIDGELDLRGHNDTIANLVIEANGVTQLLNGNLVTNTLSGAGELRFGSSAGNSATVHEGAFYGNVFGTGNLVKQTPGTLTFGGATQAFANIDFDVQQGTLHLDDAVLFTSSDSITVADGAHLTGNATITGEIIANGTVSPGSSPGLIAANTYTASNTATLVIEIADPVTGNTLDPEPGIDHDQLDVTAQAAGFGHATLGGTLDIDLLDGFNPDWGDAFTVVTYSSRTGTFDAFDGVVLSGNGTKSFAVTFEDLIGSDGVDDAVVITAAIPGDANLDGMVSIGDLSLLASSFGQTLGLGSWRMGDFNQDGEISIGDLSLLASNFGQTHDTIGAALTSSAISLELAASIVGIDLSTIPEPHSLALLTTGALLLARRQRPLAV